MQNLKSSIEFMRQKLLWPLASLRRLRARNWDSELNREQGQTIVRLALVVMLGAYLAVDHALSPVPFGFPTWLICALAYLIVSAGLALSAFRDTQSSVARRTFANVSDVVLISYTMIATGQTGVPLFVLYPWITLGNGFRFGVRPMVISAILSLVGFGTVVLLSPIWANMSMISAAVAILLVVLPLYSARILRQRGSANSTEKSHSIASGLRAALQRARLKRHDELGREQGQAVVRIVICTTVLLYLIVSHIPLDFSAGVPGWFIFLTSFIVLSLIVTVLAFRDTKSSIIRRSITNAGDVTTISYLMVSTGEAGIPLFVLYLWITLGNGFRFGLQSMAVSAVLSIAGVIAVLMLSELWQGHPMLATGVIASLILIPGYTAHLIRQLHAARQRAEEASAARGRFLARMSHELRTPLNGILGTSELLSASKRLNREDRSLLEVIRDSVKISMRQIDNVLDFSKIEAGKLLIEQIEFDLHELLNRTVRLARSIASEKNLRLTLRVDPAVPYRLVGDPHHVQEILINLVSNAVKFTENGYVSIDVTPIRVENQNVLLRLEVHDTGIGIAPAALEHIFEAFSQAESGTTRRYGGTGLGTTIAKQLADLMGGRLGVASTKDVGSVFYAELPFARQPENLEKGLSDMRALLISKDNMLNDRMTSLLRQWGVTLQTVPSTTEAEGLLRRGIRVGNPIHIVLADSHAALSRNGTHSADELLTKAALAFTPVYLLCDVSPERAQLRQWGYAGTLSYDLSPPMVFNALHASIPFDAAERGVVRIEPWAWGKSTRQRARLLVADDNRTNLMILRKILETANYEVDTAENGEQALDMILAHRYKAVILDMHMPGLDGIAVIKQYRMMSRGARAPIIMLTANATVNAKLESAEAGADAYLTKPATAATIIGTIERLLDDSEIHELGQPQRDNTVGRDTPILDTSLITELDRLYNNPTGISQILDEFENECRHLLQSVAQAVHAKNHAAFCDLLHALRGNSVNVGALRLAQTCQEAEACGLLDFRRDGAQLLNNLENSFVEALNALREFTTTGDTGPAHTSDLH